MSNHDTKTKTITLTYEEISTISCYILMTTKFREREAEAWERLATEKNPDGSPKFPNAESNARFWRDESEKLSAIREKMMAAGYGLHHQTEDDKHLVMSNGTDAFAIVAEPRQKKFEKHALPERETRKSDARDDR